MMEQAKTAKNNLQQLQALYSEARKQVKMTLPKETWREFGIVVLLLTFLDRKFLTFNDQAGGTRPIFQIPNLSRELVLQYYFHHPVINQGFSTGKCIQ